MPSHNDSRPPIRQPIGHASSTTRQVTHLAPHPDAGAERGRATVNGVRVLRACCALIVAAIAAWSSYWHMVHVALRYGERDEVAYVLPLSVDGVLTVAAIVMSEDRRNHHSVRTSAKIAFTTGLAASIAANVSAAHPTLGGRLIAAWPAVALFLIVEMLTYTRQEASNHTANPRSKDVPAQPRRVGNELGGGPEQIQHPEPEHRESIRNNGNVPGGQPRAAARRPKHLTRDLALDIMAAEPHLSRDEVATKLGISTRRLRSVLTSPAPPGSTEPERSAPAHHP